MPRIILIANRLPVTIEKKDQAFSVEESIGGLATGMSSLSKSFDCVWIGFCGIAEDKLTEDEQKEISGELAEKHQSIAVHLTELEIKNYYEGFCNETLWPLFHYFPTYARFDNTFWQTYREVNRKFCSALKNIYREGDLIWIQDYHFTLLPQMIREEVKNARIGFFLHIPFPAYEIFRLLPWRKEILKGLLGADLIGFHTAGYVNHFLDNVDRILGLENYFGEIYPGDRTVKVELFPMGIDYEKFENCLNRKEVRRNLERFKKDTDKYRVILSVDRLDYTKGILDRILCFDLFLDQHKEYRNKVVWIILAVPSRTNVTSYNELNLKVNELVGRVNGKYGTVGWIPIRYINHAMNFDEISALYSISEVALVTPWRDGMNLVAKEFVSVQKDGNGVLILSEMAGVAEELGEAIIVNPYNKEEMASAIHQALSMPLHERKRRMRPMQEKLRKNNVVQWSQNFIQALSNPSFSYYNPVRELDEEAMEEIMELYDRSDNRLIFLDYDGTLVSFKEKPEDLPEKEQGFQQWFKKLIGKINLFDTAKDLASELKLNTVLRGLSKNKKNTVVIISGRKKIFLEGKFKNIKKIILCAEHGAWIKFPESGWMNYFDQDLNWKEHIRTVFNIFIERTPGASIEEKDFSIVWHYRMVKPDIAERRVRELKSNVISIIANTNLRVYDGKKALEVKTAEINKGSAARKIIAGKDYDFIMAMGDDITDEDLFKALPAHTFTVKVGDDRTSAKFRVSSDKKARLLLQNFLFITPFC